MSFCVFLFVFFIFDFYWIICWSSIGCFCEDSVYCFEFFGYGEMLGDDVLMRVVEVICSIVECVYFKFCQEILGYFLEKLVKNKVFFDFVLRVQDEDDFGFFWVVKNFFYDFVVYLYIVSGIVEVMLYEIFDDVE